VEFGFLLNRNHGVLNVSIPCKVDRIDELLLVGLKHASGLIKLVESNLHHSLDLFGVNGEVEVHWDLWESVLEHGKLVEGKHGDDIVSVWVVVCGHVYLKLWNDVSEFDSVNIDVHGNVCANIMHGTHVNLLLSQDQIFPDVEVLVDNMLLVLLPSKEKGVEISIAGSVFCLNIIPPSPDIMVIPLE